MAFTLAFAQNSVSPAPEQVPDWSTGAAVPDGGRANIMGLSDAELATSVRNGRLSALNYPVETTGILLPYAPIKRFLAADSNDPLKALLASIASGLDGFSSLDDVQNWLGLQPYPKLSTGTAPEGSGPYFIPHKQGLLKSQRMGFTVVDTNYGRAFTISCAECHSGTLFGRTVLGMSNRFPRANQFFVRGLHAVPFVDAGFFQWATGATDGETKLFARTKARMAYIDAKAPIQLGLDTALAQVALSLSHRAQDGWATMLSPRPEPRPEKLATFPADSKPAVWWNVKYKNRWLSDGSVISGNPIFTNILWNEIGRGSDLHILQKWFERNTATIDDLTTAVFASEAPRYTDFFSAATIDLSRAKNGERLFNQTCSACHGVYDKAWNSPESEKLPLADQLATTAVHYGAQTRVVDVGTDAHRYQGMKSLEQLNELEISKRNGIAVRTQKGYVPPPLVGIWARWPYFHNNSAPSLCAVLTRASRRPASYWAREARSVRTDFDRSCNGYPVTAFDFANENTSLEEQSARLNLPRENFYDTHRAGLSNSGHDEGVFLKNGKEIFTGDEKRDLITFLQTL